MFFLGDFNVEDMEAFADNEGIENLFTKLCEASIEGRHFFVIHRDVVNWTLTNLELSARHKAHLKYLGQKYTQYGDLFTSQTIPVMRIALNEDTLSGSPDVGYTIGISNFLEKNYHAAPTKFIIENVQNDWNFYKIILDEHAKNMMNLPSYSCVRSNGGGGTTDVVIQSEVMQGYAVVCLVDTDKLAPRDDPSTTYQKADTMTALLNFSECSVLYFDAIKPREIENFIPFNILKCVPELSAHQATLKLEEFKNKCIAQGKDFAHIWNYIDLKTDTCRINLENKVKKHSLKPDTYDWVCQNIFSVMGEDKFLACGRPTLANFLSCQTAIEQFKLHIISEQWRRFHGDQFNRVLYFMAAPKKKAS